MKHKKSWCTKKIQRENALSLVNVAQETQNMHALNRAKKEIHRKIWPSWHHCAWIHHLVSKDNARTKRRVGCSYGNSRESFLIPLLSGQKKKKDLEERLRNVELGRIMYRMTDGDVKKIVHLDAQRRYALYLPALCSHLGLSIPWEWNTMQFLITLSRNS